MTELTPEQIAEGLHAHEVGVLKVLKRANRPVDEGSLQLSLRDDIKGIEEAHIRAAAERLKLKGTVKVANETVEHWVFLGEMGRGKAHGGSTEGLIRKCLLASPGIPPAQLTEKLGLPQEDVGVAFGNLKRLGLITTDAAGGCQWKEGAGEIQVQAYDSALQKLGQKGNLLLDELTPEEQAEVQKRSKKSRGAAGGVFRISERVRRSYAITDLGRSVLSHFEQLSAAGMTRQYDFSIPPPRIVFGRAHPYRAFLDWVRKKLVSLGFEEMAGDMVESEFWNSDALYMPQFHPARAIHDVYYVRGEGGGERGEGAIAKTAEPLAPFVERVAAAHENGGQTGSRGWRYRFDREWTRRMILRSQGTALSARWMAKADLKVPGKYFGIARCFRNDTVDATHAPDFFQVEGIVVSRTIDMTHLLGLLKLFAEEVARAKEVKFLPAYFPYTEPSVEVHIKHPTIGWMEMGGSGIFRPEVTRPLLGDPEARVIAWGLGLDRMAMSALGISDIRDLFSPDLEALRSKPSMFL